MRLPTIPGSKSKNFNFFEMSGFKIFRKE